MSAFVGIQGAFHPRLLQVRFQRAQHPLLRNLNCTTPLVLPMRDPERGYVFFSEPNIKEQIRPVWITQGLRSQCHAVLVVLTNLDASIKSRGGLYGTKSGRKKPSVSKDEPDADTD